MYVCMYVHTYDILVAGGMMRYTAERPSVAVRYKVLTIASESVKTLL
jgi:hypothetical protein